MRVSLAFIFVNKLVSEDHKVIGLDNINNYYDVNLKYDRLSEAGIRKEDIEDNKLVKSDRYPSYQFIKIDLEDKVSP